MRRLSFFFCNFLALWLSLRALRGEGIKSSNPGGTDGPEIESDDELGFEEFFPEMGLKGLAEMIGGLQYGKEFPFVLVCGLVFRLTVVVGLENVGDFVGDGIMFRLLREGSEVSDLGLGPVFILSCCF